MIDKRKAFDFCSRPAILYRLALLGISKKMFRVIKSMFSDSSFCVKIDNTSVTENIRSTSGIFQGCVWSPQIFIFYLDAIVDSLANVESNSPELGDTPIKHLLWADDLSLISTTIEGLQKLLDALHDFCSYWGLEVNTAKTKVIIFKKGHRRGRAEKWYYNGRELEVTHTARYLGFIFSSTGLWRQHKLLSIEKANRALRPLLSFFYRNRNLPGELFRNLYMSLIDPIVLYGSEIWGVYYRTRDGDDTVSRLMTSLAMLDKPMLKFFRIILGVHRSSASVGILMEFGVNTVFARVVHRIINYWTKISCLPETHIMKKCLIKQAVMMDQGMKPWLSYVKEILFSYGFGYVWERGTTDCRKFRTVFARRASAIHIANALAEARDKKSLEFYLSRKKTSSDIESYIAGTYDARRLTAILRLNLKYALPWLPDCVYCRMCNDWLGDVDIWNHFIYDCTGLPPVGLSTPRLPYPYCVDTITTGKASDLWTRLLYATRKVNLQEAGNEVLLAQ